MKTYKNKWFEFTTGLHGIRLSYTPCSYYNYKQIIVSLGWGIFFINIGESNYEHDVNDTDDYGFYFYESALWIQMGKKIKCINMPWQYEWIRTGYLLKSGEWYNETKGNFIDTDKLDIYNETKGNFIDTDKLDIYQETHQYIYTLNSGDIQVSSAKISVEEREWGFSWTPLFRKKKKEICIEFENEIGERAGHWKGGTLGCSYAMEKGETPFDTLIRMQLNRKFQ